MGACLSTVLPRRVLGTPREGSPKRITPPSDESDIRELPREVNGEGLQDSVNSKYLPDSVQSKSLPNGTPRKHSATEEHNKLPDDAHDKSKRRALLVGITYSSPSNTWSELDGPHGDVDQYRDLLICA